MRVCFYHAGPEWSGNARDFADAATALRGQEYAVTFVCARGSPVERRLSAAGHDVIGVRTGGGWLRAAWRLRRVLRQNFVEAVFVHTEREQLAAALAVRLADRGAVVRRMPPFGRVSLGGEARFAARIAATGFLFVFDADLRAAQPPPRALEPFVAPPGVAPSLVTRAQYADRAPRIACFFSEGSRGPVSVALRAMALLAERHSDLRFSLLGPGDRDESLKMQAASLGILTRVDRPLDDATPASDRAMLESSDVGWVIAGGTDAMFGILDCFACGVPVVSERNPLSAQLVRDGESGVLTTALDAASCAALIAGLLADTARRERLAQGARAAADAWPMEAMAEGFVRATAAARDRTRWHV